MTADEVPFVPSQSLADIFPLDVLLFFPCNVDKISSCAMLLVYTACYLVLLIHVVLV